MRARAELVDAVNRRVFRAVGRVAPRLSARQTTLLGRAVGRVALPVDWSHLQTLRRNLTLTLGHEPAPALMRAAIASWVRVYVEVQAVAGWDPGRAVASVCVDPVQEARLREAYASTGAVVALPHMGNWDLAGAWACATGMPVTTVAERLGEQEFAAFTAIRRRIGMEVYAHDDPGAMRALVTAVREGRVVCLMGDRDLPGTGLSVDWAGHEVTLPPGPAMVARRSGAALFAAATHYTPDGIVIEISDPVEHRPGRDGLQAMTQDLADHFCAAVRRHPQDWHMFQPFLAVDRTTTDHG
ncbi:phosphatidylinositol mannoside acyltransferase [Mariniluteicoccus endophyticus]